MFSIFALFLAQHFKYQKLCELFSHPGSPQGSIDNYISGPKGSNQHFLLETEIILLLYPDCPCSEIYQCFNENILDLIDHVNYVSPFSYLPFAFPPCFRRSTAKRSVLKSLPVATTPGKTLL